MSKFNAWSCIGEKCYRTLLKQRCEHENIHKITVVKE